MTAANTSISFPPADRGKHLSVALGTALFLIAVGAVLRFAINASTHGVNIHTIGVILMIVGGVGLIISLFWMTVWADRRRRTVAPGATYPAETAAPGARTYPPDEPYSGPPA